MFFSIGNISKLKFNTILERPIEEKFKNEAKEFLDKETANLLRHFLEVRDENDYENLGNIKLLKKSYKLLFICISLFSKFW